MSQFLTVVPLARLPRSMPQLLSYTSPAPLQNGALVRVPIGNRTVNAIVLDVQPVNKAKSIIKQLPYQLRAVEHILIEHPILWPWQQQLLRWLASFYFESPSLIAKTLLPATFAQRKTAPTIEDARNKKQDTNTNVSGDLRFVTASFAERLQIYRDIITTAHNALILCPDRRRRDLLAKELDIPVFDASLPTGALMDRWNALRTGSLATVVGTRSALMAPFPRPETVIIEAESSDHHASWDQHPRIDVRTIAEWLHATHQTTVLFGDTMPTIERTARYDHTPPAHTNTPITVVDLRTADRDSDTGLSYSLATSLEKTIRTNGRAFLFVARRGAATLILCQDCGFRITCPHCAVPLVLHTAKQTNILRCHHCGHHKPSPTMCPSCSSHNIRYAGSGTQRIAETLTQRFPKTTIVRIDSDTDTDEAFAAAHTLEDGIIVGTELALQDPTLTMFDLTAAATIETLLHLPDYTATERAARLVATLRERSSTSTVIQTYNPDSTIFNYKNMSPAALYEREITARRAHHYPPFAQIILCRFSHKDSAHAREQATIVHDRLERQAAHLDIDNRILLLGPAPAFSEKRRGLAQWQIVVKWLPSDTAMTTIIADDANSQRNRLLAVIPDDWDITVDPVSLL